MEPIDRAMLVFIVLVFVISFIGVINSFLQ